MHNFEELQERSRMAGFVREGTEIKFQERGQ
jgi:hypothetical protein